MPSSPRLSPDEDGALRRLHYFESAGAQLADHYASLKDTLRERDRRDEVRQPADEVEPLDVATLQRVAAIPHRRPNTERQPGA